MNSETLSFSCHGSPGSLVKTGFLRVLLNAQNKSHDIIKETSFTEIEQHMCSFINALSNKNLPES